MRASLTALAPALLLIAAVAASGCGLKDDLYLPEEEAAPPAADSADDRSEDERGEPDA